MRVKNIIILSMITILICIFTGCDAKGDVVGTYKSSYGTVLEIKDDGTLEYDSPYKKRVKEGEWEIKDNKIILSGCESYDLYASIDNFDDELYIEAKKGTWIPETFKKEN